MEIHATMPFTPPNDLFRRPADLAYEADFTRAMFGKWRFCDPAFCAQKPDLQGLNCFKTRRLASGASRVMLCSQCTSWVISC